MNFKSPDIIHAQASANAPSAVEISRIGYRRDSDIEPADHHLVPGLISKVHNRVWIGVIRIVGRVIEVRDALDPASFGQQHRLGENVYELPVEIISGNAEQGAGLPGRIDHLVDEVLATKVHMRHQIYQPRARPPRAIRS